MIQTQTFSAIGKKSFEITVSSVSQAYTCIASVVGPMVRITCDGPNDAFIEWADTTAGLTATVPTANTTAGALANPGSMRLKAGAIEVFATPTGCFALIAKPSESSSISITFGYGN